MAGTLFVVATPIGNLEDLSFRALRTLKEVDLIAAEDTRRTSKLLAHYQVSRPLVSLHEHNEHTEAPRLVRRLSAGESVALVSDAGTPGISDPGAHLVRLAREAGLTVVPIPGPSAVTAALSVTGLALDGFVFAGFPPPSGAARERWFEGLAAEHRAVVFFESPHRIERTLQETSESVGIRQISVHRELTKIHESFVICTTGRPEHSDWSERGEFVLVVSPLAEPDRPNLDEANEDRAMALFGQMTDGAKISHDDAVLAVAAITGLPSPRLPRILKRAAIRAKRRLESQDPSVP